jgi:hypothetical protein
MLDAYSCSIYILLPFKDHTCFDLRRLYSSPAKLVKSETMQISDLNPNTQCEINNIIWKKTKKILGRMMWLNNCTKTWICNTKCEINFISRSGFSVFFKCTSTSLFTGGTFLKIWKIFMKIFLYNTLWNKEVHITILSGEK